MTAVGLLEWLVTRGPSMCVSIKESDNQTTADGCIDMQLPFVKECLNMKHLFALCLVICFKYKPICNSK